MSDADAMTRAEQLAVAHTQPVAWRVGRKIPRNLYAGNLDVGRMDTAELAQQVVLAVNLAEAQMEIEAAVMAGRTLPTSAAFAAAVEAYRNATWNGEA